MPAAGPRLEALDKAIKQSFDSDALADVTIRLGAVELPAHSLVLTSQSSYFQRSLQSEMKEASTRKFEYSEGSIQAYWRVFEYMYTGQYSAEPCLKLDDQDDDELSKDVRVYQLADYFEIDGLRDFALQRFQAKINNLWVSGAFPDCIRVVYESTTDVECKMRRAVVDIAFKNLHDLWAKEPFKALLRDGGDFGVDLMTREVGIIRHLHE